MEQTLNKFARSISNGNTALADRASLVAKAAKLAQEDLVRKLESEINNKELEIFKLCDVSPENTQDTKPRGLAAENPGEWVKKLHDLKVSVAVKKEELDIAKATLKEWFDESTPVAGQ